MWDTVKKTNKQTKKKKKSEIKELSKKTKIYFHGLD